MNTKKKLHTSIFLAVYGFASAILYPTFMGMALGFDAAIPDGAITLIAIDFIIGIVGVIAAIIYSRKLSAEKIEQLSGEISQSISICQNCKTNVKSGTQVCPKCGNEIR